VSGVHKKKSPVSGALRLIGFSRRRYFFFLAAAFFFGAAFFLVAFFIGDSPNRNLRSKKNRSVIHI
jgi:VIT1/CCC1 family predicted Fe2+/Mn2+ transporter